MKVNVDRFWYVHITYVTYTKKVFETWKKAFFGINRGYRAIYYEGSHHWIFWVNFFEGYQNI